jgi:hypothetical protein
MKNSPKDEWFDRLEKRLRNYTENPDDELWNRISSVGSHAYRPLWVTWTNRIGAAVALMAFALLWVLQPEGSHSEGLTAALTEKESFSDQKNSESSASPRLADAAPSKLTIKELRYDNGKKENDHARASVPSTEKSNSTKLAQHAASTTFVAVGDLAESSETIYRKEQKNAIEQKEDAQENSEIDKIVIMFEKDSSNQLLPSSSVAEKPLVEEEEQKKKRAIVGYASLAPMLSYQKVTPIKNDGIMIEQFGTKSIFSSGRLGINLEAGIQWLLSKRLEMYSGLSLYQQSQTLSYSTQSNKNISVQQDNFAYSVMPANDEKQLRYSMLNAGIQTGMIYHIKGDKLAHKIGAGLSYQYGLQKAGDGRAYNNSASQYLFYQVFYRNEFSVTSSLKIFVQPFYARSFFTKEKLVVPFTLKPSRAGLSFGVVYRFD